MGLFERLFGSKHEIPKDQDVDHPVLGPIHMDSDSSWFARSVSTIGCKGNPSVSIDGDASGPFDSSVATYQRLRSDWDSIKASVADTLLELNQNYFSEERSQMLVAADDIWPTAELLAVRVGLDGCFDLTYTFDWQRPSDDHQVTVCFEDWQCMGTSIDG